MVTSVDDFCKLPDGLTVGQVQLHAHHLVAVGLLHDFLHRRLRFLHVPAGDDDSGP